MDTKISSDFWAKPAIEAVSREIRYAALWLLTNDRISLCGHAIVSARRFAFETGLPESVFAEALQALPDTFTAVQGGYWARGYIRRQFGHGPALARSNMSQAVVNALHDAPTDVVQMVLAEYPELAERFSPPSPSPTPPAQPIGTPSEPLAKHSPSPRREAPSPTQGQRVREGAGERAREAPERQVNGTSPPRDALFEALASVTGHDIAQLTAAARGVLNAALKQIRNAAPNVTPDDIRARAQRYRDAHPTWALTPPSLAKHWPTLDGKARERRNAPPVETEPAGWREWLKQTHPDHPLVASGDVDRKAFGSLDFNERSVIRDGMRKAS